MEVTMRRKILSAVLAFLMIGTAVTGCTNSEKTSSPDLQKFVETMSKENFVQEGSFVALDTIELASQKQLISCFGNNAGSAYVVPFLPPAPNQAPSTGVHNAVYDWADEKPSVYYDETKTDNYPANPYFSPVGWSYKLADNEAVVLVGELPPECKYYSFINYIFFSEIKSGKDYSKEKGFFQIGTEETGFYHPIFGSLGAPINPVNIKSQGGEKYGAKFAIIVTGDKNTFTKTKNALISAGIAENIINESPLPAATLNMGLEKGKDTFTTLMRISQPTNQTDYESYINSLGEKFKVYRITPKDENAEKSLYTAEYARERGTGKSEVSILPDAPQTLDEIRAKLIEEYGDEYTYEELSAEIAVPEGMTAYLNDTNAQGDNRDTTYLMTKDFTLNSDEDFIVVYGVNHTKTNKATYSNTVLYSRPMLNGIASVYDSLYEGSSEKYLDALHENRGSYYVYKFARKQTDDYTRVIEYSEGNEKGEYYGADNGDTLLLAYRAYLEPETGVGASYYEIIYDRAIVFHKK